MNVETFLISELGTRLEVPVLGEVPEERPQRFVTIERVGGGAREWGLVDRALVAVQSWAETRYEASCLADAVDAAMLGLIGAYPITNVERNALTNFPTADKIPRYQGTYQITAHNI